MEIWFHFCHESETNKREESLPLANEAHLCLRNTAESRAPQDAWALWSFVHCYQPNTNVPEGNNYRTTKEG